MRDELPDPVHKDNAALAEDGNNLGRGTGRLHVLQSQREKAEEFREMHGGRSILVLPNAWDVPSARVFEELGFRAVGTSSAALMVSLGYPDGEEIERCEMVAAVRRIAGAVSVPLTADVVSGFGETPKGVSMTVKSVVEAGAVGVNVEDFVHETKKLRPVRVQLERLRALVELKRRTGIPFVINARTDALRYAEGDESARFREAVRRAAAYRDSGADCVYPMGITDAASISAFVKELDCPVNVMVRPGLPPVGELQRLGVARLSFGPSAAYAVFGLLKRVGREVLEKGTYSSMLEGAITYEELNRLARKR